MLEPLRTDNAGTASTGPAKRRDQSPTWSLEFLRSWLLGPVAGLAFAIVLVGQLSVGGFGFVAPSDASGDPGSWSSGSPSGNSWSGYSPSGNSWSGYSPSGNSWSGYSPSGNSSGGNAPPAARGAAPRNSR